MKAQRIDIVGAGISGLATAHFLAKQLEDIEIHVWERDAAPGGLAGTFSTDDFTVEKFYHHIFRRDVALQGLIRELGLGEDLVWREANTGAYYFERPYRLSSPLDLLKFKPLPPLDRVRLGLMVLKARRVRGWHDLDEITAEEYIRTTAGDRVYEVVWEPLLRGKFGAEAAGVSAAWLWSKLIDRGGSRDRRGHEVLGYLRGGLGRLFDKLVAVLRSAGHQVHLGCSVHRLEGSGDRIDRIVTDNGTFSTDLVISGAQLPDLVGILPASVDGYRRSLSEIGFLGNVCLVVTLRESLSDFYWTNVTDVAAPFVGIVEQTNWADPEDFHHKHVAYLSAYVPEGDSRSCMDAEELLGFYRPWVVKMFPEFDDGLVEAKYLWRARYAQPIVHVGYHNNIPAISSPIPNLFVCTMAQIYPHDRQVSNGVDMAKRTAEMVHARLGEVGR